MGAQRLSGRMATLGAQLLVFTCSPLSLSGASHTSLHVSLPSSLGFNHYGFVLFHQGR